VVDTVTRPIGNFFSGLAHLPSLEQRNRDLEAQARDLQAQIAASRYIAQQEQQLSDLLQLRSSLDPESIAAVVTGNGVSNFEWTVTIDKGSDAGIAVDMPVVTGTGEGATLVGRVAQVAPNGAMVQLLIDRRFSVAGVLTDSRANGLVVGHGDEDLVMSLVDPGTPIAQPESVFTQGYCVANQPGLYPPGILIGQVSRTTRDGNAIERSVSVSPAADFASLQFVLVLKARNDCP
jgi:rod shape-determining protein MreC